MSENDKIQEIDPVEKSLSPKEVKAYRYWKNSREAELAPATQAKLFSLYLNGKTTHEIQALNPGFSLGQVVYAKIKGEWDRRRNEHLDYLLNTVQQRVIQVTAESAIFIADLLSATNKYHGEAIKKYLQTGDPSDLGELQINSLQGYTRAVELLQKLTGQDKQQKLLVDGVVTHKTENDIIDVPVTAEEAGDMLKKILEGKKDE